MANGQGLAKPQIKSLVGTAIVVVAAMLGSEASPMLGYAFALLALIMIIVALSTNSIWPSNSRKENSLVFSLFWGLMLGLVVPYLVTIYLEGGLSAVYELYRAEP